MAKVIKLKKDEDIEQLNEKLQSARNNMRGIKAEKYAGAITLREDPVAYQNRMRNEWN